MFIIKTVGAVRRRGPRGEQRRPERQLVVRAAAAPPPEREELLGEFRLPREDEAAVHRDLGTADAVLVAQQVRVRQRKVRLRFYLFRGDPHVCVHIQNFIDGRVVK